ncbi:MAG: N-acetyltransferase family protein [Chloroflexota bacterium]
MSITIRHLTEDDWQAYRDLRLEALAEAPEAFASSPEEQLDRSPEDWRAAVRQHEQSFVLGAFAGNTLVGMVSLARDMRSKTRHKGTVRGLYVVPSQRGRNIARLLMAALIREARAPVGLEQLNLSVVADNLSARALYERMGFVPYGREPHALKIGDRYLDDELMVLFL